jgi:Rieske Fe-S protein
MNRKEFIKACGLTCLNISLLTPILTGCSGIKTVSLAIKNDSLYVPLSEFEKTSGKQEKFFKYVIVENETLSYPICVYRLGKDNYTALLMKCTHLGNELTAHGTRLYCSAHGSEFDAEGQAVNGPATQSLHKFPVTIENQQLKISLSI